MVIESLRDLMGVAGGLVSFTWFDRLELMMYSEYNA